MNRQIVELYTLLLVIFYVLFPQNIIAQNSEIENNLYIIRDEISGKEGGVDIYNEVIIPFEYDDLLLYPTIINMKKESQVIFERNVIEFVTVAAECCKFLEQAEGMKRTTFVDTALKILPLLYLAHLFLI